MPTRKEKEKTAAEAHALETLQFSCRWAQLPGGVHITRDKTLGYVLNVHIKDRYIGSITPYKPTKTGDWRWGVGVAHNGVDFDTPRDAALALYCCSVYGRMLVSS